MPITPRSSPSAQNPGPGGSVPGSSVPQNQMVPQSPGNPRYKPGIGPDPNPRVVVKAVNPPVTPDQVVSMAEIPEAATIDLPKIQNIKIPPVKNKTVQGHLKAIEAKMIATENLMKDIVKLQRVQIHTEKELFERKRELYQNTFEEYLLDKTIDFEDPDNPPDCTCINLPKKPPGGPGFPPINKPPNKPPDKPTGEAPAVEIPNWAKGIDLAALAAFMGISLFELIKMLMGGNLSPQAAYEIAPSLFAEAPAGATPAGVTPESTPMSAVLNQPDLSQDPGMEGWLSKGEYDPVSQAAAPALTPEEATRQLTEEIEGQQTEYKPVYSPGPVAVNPLDRILKGFTDPPSLSEVTGLPISEDLEMALETVTMLQGGSALQVGAAGAAKAPAIAQTVRRLGVPFISRVPGLKRLFGLSDDVAEITVKAGKAGTGAADDVAAISGAADDVATTAAAPRTPVSPTAEAMKNTRQRALRGGGSRQNLGGRVRDRRLKPDSKTNPRRTVQSEAAFRQQQGELADDALESLVGMKPGQRVKPGQSTNALEQFNQNVESFTGDAVKSLDKIYKTQASGGMGDVELFNSDALNYFRGMSSKIMPMASGGFMTTNEKAEYYMERLLNQALGVARRYDEAKAKAPNVETTTGSVVIPKSGGGLVGWWNKGRNMRVPSENTASWKDLMADDAKQITRTNKAFKSGATGMKGWNPIKAFTPEMVRTGPTPAVRQAFERPVRTATHPIMMALEFIVNDLLLNPRSTAVYDQVTGPNAYYKAPGYKGPMPSQNLENAQSSMMSGNNDQKPEVVPLPPEYIKIPGKKIAPNYVGNESPDIEMKSSVFTRSSTHID